ncbi:hypothetical protein FOL47_004169 [Perkinsus chesapeaki]|uniref:MLO-like protein n=1 Tax=Perkinsus chesapeaki TaxID=330153 RepID=A0A7J6M448_PERCH|nr:hypothetical protein FOL47_004169 [Perkinsus chesapeaki]
MTESDTSREGLSSTAANILMALVAFVAVLSLVFEWAQHMVMKGMSRKHDPELFIKLAEAFFRELTILGFVGVVLFIIEQSGVLISLADGIGLSHEEILHQFHLVHLVVFLVMVTYVLIVALLTRRLSNVIIEWNAAEYANTSRVCMAVDRAREGGSHDKAKKAVMQLYQYKLLRFSFLFPYAGGIDPKKRGANPKTFQFHRYLRNCLVEDTINIVTPSKGVTLALIFMAMAARPLYTLAGPYLMASVIAIVVILDVALALLTRHVKQIFVALLPAKLPLSFVKQFEPSEDGDERTTVRSSTMVRSYTRQLEDRAEDRLRKLHGVIGGVWTVEKAVKKFKQSASLAREERSAEGEAEESEEEQKEKDFTWKSPNVYNSEEEAVGLVMPNSTSEGVELCRDETEGAEQGECSSPVRSVRIEVDEDEPGGHERKNSVASSGNESLRYSLDIGM